MKGKYVSSMFVLSLSFAFQMLYPLSAFAASGHETHDYSTLSWPVCNFIIFLVLMVYFYKKHGAGVIYKRSVEVKEFLEKARISLAHADEKLSSLDERLSAIDIEKEELRNRFDKEGRVTAEAIIKNSNELSERIIEDTKRQIDSEIGRAKLELRQEASKIALEAARSRLQVEITDDKDRELRKESLAEALF